MARISVEAIRREQILDAAIGLVAAKGYEATTVRDIARAADVSTGTIAYYFAGKDDVLRSALVEAARRFGERVEEALAGASTPSDRLVAHGETATPRGDRDRANQVVWLEFWARAQRDEELRALHERVYDSWRTQIAGTIRDGIGEGSFRSVDPDLFARRFVALLDGLALHVLLHPGSVSSDDMSRTLRDYVSATLSP